MDEHDTGVTNLAVSNSELSTWQGCRRRWYLKYYLWRAPDPSVVRPVGVMWLGQRVHVALEYWYGHDADPFTVLAIVYNRAAEERPDVQDELQDEREVARLMIEGYLGWVQDTGADEGLTVVSTERDVQAEGPRGVKLRARLDMRVRRDWDGATMFIDHKTVGDFANAASMLEIDGQMRFYALIDRLEAQRAGQGQRTDGGIYNMLKRSKRTARATPPFYHREEIRYNDETLRSTYYRVTALIDEILDARRTLGAGQDHRTVVYPNPGRDCSWRCEFASVCPLMDDGSRWTDMVENVYTVADPYGYYLPSELPELVALRKDVTVEGT